MPARSFYSPPDFEHLSVLLRDAHGRECEETLGLFEGLRFAPLHDKNSLAIVLGISTRKLISITCNKELHYRQFFLRKKSGGRREINTPRTYLKVIQWWILDNILRFYEFPTYVKGFVRGQSALTNAVMHHGNQHVLNMDLKDFFPSIDLDRVKGIFIFLGYNIEVAELLSEICTLHECLPQGAPTSPSLANICARDLDRELSKIATDNGYRYSRYADDLTFSFHEKIPTEFMEIVSKIIEQQGFEANPEKTRFLGSGNQINVTGYVINDHPQPPRKWRNRLRGLLYAVANNPEKFMDQLDKLHGYRGAIVSYAPPEGNKLLVLANEAIASVKAAEK